MGVVNLCAGCWGALLAEHHELHLSDLATGQGLGQYHAWPECAKAAARKVAALRVLDGRPAVVGVNVFHPERCDPAACEEVEG